MKKYITLLYQDYEKILKRSKSDPPLEKQEGKNDNNKNEQEAEPTLTESPDAVGVDSTDSNEENIDSRLDSGERIDARKAPAPHTDSLLPSPATLIPPTPSPPSAAKRKTSPSPESSSASSKSRPAASAVPASVRGAEKSASSMSSAPPPGIPESNKRKVTADEIEQEEGGQDAGRRSARLKKKREDPSWSPVWKGGWVTK